MTIRPLPSVRMCRMAGRVVRKTPVRSTSIVRCHSASVYSQAGLVGPLMPAFATRVEIGPSTAVLSANAASTASSSVTSTSARWRKAGSSRTGAQFRSQPDTWAPSSVKRRATARPIPRAAPVTMTVRFWSSKDMASPHLFGTHLRMWWPTATSSSS
jgi:hypothetical protein